ncbi:hypothetical protein KXX11_004457, partial [Aspergillus fumigatus]
ASEACLSALETSGRLAPRLIAIQQAGRQTTVLLRQLDHTLQVHQGHGPSRFAPGFINAVLGLLNKDAQGQDQHQQCQEAQNQEFLFELEVIQNSHRGPRVTVGGRNVATNHLDTRRASWHLSDKGQNQSAYRFDLRSSRSLPRKIRIHSSAGM